MGALSCTDVSAETLNLDLTMNPMAATDGPAVPRQHRMNCNRRRFSAAQLKKHVAALCVRDGEERRHVPPGDDQRVAGRDWKGVANDNGVFAVVGNAILGQ
jgi:hypothetical protein